LVLSTDSVTAYPGKATPLPTATVFDSDHRVISSGVSWTTADSAIARINTGAVMGFGEGATTITAAAGTVSASAQVFVVQEPVVAINSNISDRFLIGDDSLQVYAWGVGPLNDSLSGHPVTLSAILPALATISSAGMVHIHGTGTAKLLASTDGFADTISFTVDARRVASMRVTPDTVFVAVGQESPSLSIALYDSKGDLLPYYWYASGISSNTQIVSWDDYFETAIGVSVGSAEIILKADTVVVHVPVVVTAH
jgi:hypothetical protein